MAGKGGGQPQGPKCWACNALLANAAVKNCVVCGQQQTLSCSNPKCVDAAGNQLQTLGKRCGNCGADMTAKPASNAAKANELNIEATKSGRHGNHEVRVQVYDAKNVGVAKNVVVGHDCLKCYNLGGGKALLISDDLAKDPALPYQALIGALTPKSIVPTNAVGLLICELHFLCKEVELYFAIEGNKKDTKESHPMLLDGPPFTFEPSTPAPAKPSFKDNLALLAERRQQKIRYNKGL